jgi:hypothetical protein
MERSASACAALEGEAEGDGGGVWSGRSFVCAPADDAATPRATAKVKDESAAFAILDR